MSFPDENATTLRPISEVEPLMIGTTRARFVAPGTVTQGRFGLYEWTMQPQAGGGDAHYHKTFSESFFVVSGTVQLYAGTRWVTATAGDFLHVAEGGPHGFKNDSDDIAQMLILFAPGVAREGYFEALAEIRANGRTLSDDEWVELWAKHDQYPC
jgi:quercetin dioxygenase-like cupin family protein